MIDFTTAYPNSRKVYDERPAQLTAGGPEVTLQVPMREVALSRGDPRSVVRHERAAGPRRQRRTAEAAGTVDRGAARARTRRHAAPLRAARRDHAGDGIRRRARKPAGGIRPLRSRPRPRHHPGQRQPPRARADGHRPQFPGQDQRDIASAVRSSIEDEVEKLQGRRLGDDTGGPPTGEHPGRANDRAQPPVPSHVPIYRRREWAAGRRPHVGIYSQTLSSSASREWTFHRPRRAAALHPADREACDRHRSRGGSIRRSGVGAPSELLIRASARIARSACLRRPSRSATDCARGRSPTPTTSRIRELKTQGELTASPGVRRPGDEQGPGQVTRISSREPGEALEWCDDRRSPRSDRDHRRRPRYEPSPRHARR